MQTRRNRRLSSGAWTVASLVLLAVATCGAQPVEHDVPCVEGVVGQVAYGDFSSGCTIAPGTDTDQFTFCGAANEDVLITAAGATNDLDLRVEVFGSSGAVGSPATCGSVSTNVCAVRLELTLPATDCYTVNVSEVGADNTGPYSFQLERLFPPSAVAQAVGFGQSVTTKLNPISDLDAYVFEAEAGSLIRVLVGGQSNDLDLRLTLLDTQGAVLATSSCSAVSTTTCTTSVNPAALAVTGTYQFYVREDQSDQSGDYSVTLVCLAGPCLNASTTTSSSTTTTTSTSTTPTTTPTTSSTSTTTTKPTTTSTSTTGGPPTTTPTTTTSTAAPATTVVPTTTSPTSTAPPTSTTLPSAACQSLGQPVRDGTPCDDGDACVADTCQAGTCTNDPLCGVTVAEQGVSKKGNKPLQAIAVRCSIDGATGFCEAQGFVPQSIVDQFLKPQRVAPIAAADTGSDDADVAVTKRARAAFDRFGVARFQLKLNRIGKRVLKKAARLGIPLEVTVKFRIDDNGDVKELRRLVRLARGR